LVPTSAVLVHHPSLTRIKAEAWASARQATRRMPRRSRDSGGGGLHRPGNPNKPKPAKDGIRRKCDRLRLSYRQKLITGFRCRKNSGAFGPISWRHAGCSERLSCPQTSSSFMCWKTALLCRASMSVW